jgi:peptidoglycan hydrolase-like protein with peptidoglycan-binding domain
MSRSVWVTAGVSALAFVLASGAASAAQTTSLATGTARGHDKQPPGSHLRLGARRPSHVNARANKPRRIAVTLAPGSGYQQAAGSGRVRALQRRLAGMEFAPGPIDGRYGPLTTAAVERFQAALGLRVDGISGHQTLTALSGLPRGAIYPGAGYQQAGGSERVRALQRRLAGMGFIPGPIDGRYGPLTTRAVERFQSAHHLSLDGIVGIRTLRALKTAGPRATPGRGASRHPVPQTKPLPAGPAPEAKPAPVQGQPQRPPALPVTPVLLALAALGLATVSVSYRRAGRRLRRAHAAARPRPQTEQRPGRSDLLRQGGPAR